MSARMAQRPMTGIPAAGFEVRVGHDRDGTPKVAVDGDKYRAVSLPITDPAILRRLIADLEEAAEWLATR